MANNHRPVRTGTLWITLTLALAVLCPASVAAATDLVTRLGCDFAVEPEPSPQSAEQSQALCRSPLGSCDPAWVRDPWQWDASRPITHVRLYFHIFREDDGSNAAMTPLALAQRIAELNADFLPLGFQFVYDWRYVDDSQYRHNVILGVNYDAMKLAHNLDPHRQINVYVTDASHSFQTFPWETSRILSWGGGIVMRIDHMTTAAFWKTLQHEVGHYFGLLHSFNGYEESNWVRACNHPCQENPGTGGSDVLGDMCEDTPPQYKTFDCIPLSGIDSCSGMPWDNTFIPTNVMSYSLCRADFTPNQVARMHCWVRDILRSLRLNPEITAPSVAMGQVPLGVSFDGSFEDSATAWRWQFGDGDSAAGHSPMHTYTEPGWYAVTLHVDDTAGQTYGSLVPGLVYAHAETLLVEAPPAEAGQPIRVDISINNHIPLTRVEVPFRWSGDLPLQFDSVSTDGLRTSHISFDDGSLIQWDLDTTDQRAAYSLFGTNVPIDSGSGPILSIYFSPLPFWLPDSGQVTLEAYNVWSPELWATPGSLVPALGAAQPSTIACCGGIRGDTNDDQNITSSDIIYLVNHVFKGGPAPQPLWQAGDLTCDGTITSSDVIFLVNYIFKAGPAGSCGP